MRSENLSQAIAWFSEIFSKSLFEMPDFLGKKQALIMIIVVLFFTAGEWIGREKEYAIANITLVRSKPLRWIFYTILLLSLYFFGNFYETVEFIYYQF